MKYYVDHEADDTAELLWQQEAAGSQIRSQSAEGGADDDPQTERAADATAGDP